MCSLVVAQNTIASLTQRPQCTEYCDVTSRQFYRDADKSLARPTSQYILFDGENISFDGENISFDASLVIYVYIYIYIYIYK